MKMTWMPSERPSSPPATVAFGGLSVGNEPGAAFLSTRLLASISHVAEGRSASIAGPAVCAPSVDGTHAKGRDLKAGAKQAAIAQQFDSKQISVTSVYRTTGVGGVPPRGRPD